MGSPAKARAGNRVLPTNKEVGIAFVSARAKPLFVHRQKTAEPSPYEMLRLHWLVRRDLKRDAELGPYTLKINAEVSVRIA